MRNFKRKTMNANELRIGNYVDFCGISKILELHSEEQKFDNVYLECEESFEWSEYEKLQPIPLTEEILLKCGFESYKGWDDQVYWYLPKEKESNTRFELYETNQGYELPSGQICEYLHILQNCYYFHTLNNEELTVNL